MPGMVLEGVVSNVAAFGAFVDIGVHQDGLVHVSELANRFVNDPREVVKVGDIVKVRVLDVDAARRRISLSMRAQAKGAEAAMISREARGMRGGLQTRKKERASAPTGAMAAAFAKLKLR